MSTGLIIAILKVLPLIVGIVYKVMEAREKARKEVELHDVGKALMEDDVDEIARFLDGIDV